ncbi:hypothetical protein [Clostridium celatum]|uniref:hypothetical protein n=1 Tax=Clostridium celatum TaxID=36834 RepID=UPI00189708B2|nr:hypothetical protein [Clostridium celatum]
MYLSGSGTSFGFKHPKINEILPDDIEISDDIYKRFFKEQEQGKEFKIRNKNGETFEEIFEEVM